MNISRGSGGVFSLVVILFLSVRAQDIDANSTKSLSSQELSRKALQAFRNRDLSESKRLYRILWEKKDASLEDITTAGRMLAYLEHHFHDNLSGVYPYYDEIIKRNPQKVDHYLRLADFEIRSHRFRQAKETLERALKENPSDEQQRRIDILLFKVVLEQWIWEQADRPDVLQLKNQLLKIEGYAGQNPEDIELAYLQMGLSLISKNKIMFWEGWHNYFRLPKDQQTRSFLSKSQHYLTLGLEAWEKAGVSLDLIKGLAFSRLYDLAMMILKYDSTSLNEYPYIERLRDYYRYIHQTRENAFSYYRGKALGNNDVDSYFAKQDKLDLWMWERLKGNAEKRNYSKKNLESELYRHFGLKMMFTGRGESQDLIIFGGHGYIEETVEIEQYGRKGSFTYIKLHNFVGNIYDHWYQDYMGIGGWASTEGEVMQVRNWYVNYPVSVWNRLNDQEAREAWLKNINMQMEKDAELLKDDPYAFPTGFADHIKFLSYDQMIQGLKQKGLSGRALKMAFLSDVEYFFEYTGMHLHEARHVLDNPIFLANKEEYPLEVREFRAKLSEIVFSPDPHLVVAESILEEGTANRKVVEVIVRWMQENKDTIKDFDATKPVIMQLMSLTKDQLIEAVRSVDPFYLNR